jgi:hypothetical protein
LLIRNQLSKEAPRGIGLGISPIPLRKENSILSRLRKAKSELAFMKDKDSKKSEENIKPA